MADYRLTIESGQRGFDVALLTYNPDVFSEEDITRLIDSEVSHVLYANSSYSFSIKPIPDHVTSAAIYINGIQPTENDLGKVALYQYDAQEGRFELTGNNTRLGILHDIWGYVQIHLRFQLDDGSFEDLYSEYIQVDNDSVNMMGMAKYVYAGYPELMTKNHILNSKILSESKMMAEGPLDLKLAQIRKVARVYDKHFNYFKTNARFTTKQQDVVDKLEKLSFATSQSLQYAVQHPEELYQVNTQHGIRVGRQVFHPKRIMMRRNVTSYDTYENRAIIDFLEYIQRQLEGISKTIEGLLDQDKRYFLSLFDNLFSRDYLKNKGPEIAQLQSSISRLIARYSNALGIKPSIFRRAPRATHIFQEVLPYREIFDCIREWQQGVYDFDQSRFLLFCIGSSRVYESFVLIALLHYLHDQGYAVDAFTFTYDIVDQYSHNVSFNNTYRCTRDDRIITVYYQPVVYSDGRMLNGIELRRSKGDHAVDYYTPDYIFKIEKRTASGTVFKNAHYIICDAKFSNLENVRTQSLQKVLDKYEQQISPLNEANIANHCIVYGKYEESDPIYVTYGETAVYKDRVNPQNTTATILPVSFGLMETDPKLFVDTINRMLSLK